MAGELTPWVEQDAAETDEVEKYIGNPELGPWMPPTLGQAEWAMRRLSNAEGAWDEIEQEANAAMLRIQEWKQDAQRHFAREIDFFTRALELYGLARRAATGAATTPLPSGKVKTRWVDPKLVVDDEKAVVDWLDKHGYHDAINTKKTVLVSQLPGRVVVADRIVGYRIVMADGSWSETEGPDEPGVSVGELIDGVPVVDVKAMTSPHAVDNNGEAVPGLSVEAGHVRPGVKSDRQAPVLDRRGVQPDGHHLSAG